MVFVDRIIKNGEYRVKKFLLLVFILGASLCCTACINNLAIQELNQIGKEYLDKGDYESAIGRFQSSVDLDENVFESRYNLGVAYIKKEDFKNASIELEKAIKINPSSPDAYYSYAVALEGSARPDTDELEDEDKIPPVDTDLINEAVLMYQKYLELSPDAKDKEAVLNHINELSEISSDKKEE